MATTVPSGRSRRRISPVKVPTPGPYSTMVVALLQSTWSRSRLTRKRELGISEPSMRGCLMKLRLKRTSDVVTAAPWRPRGSAPPLEVLRDRASCRVSSLGDWDARSRPSLKIQGFGHRDKGRPDERALDWYVGIRVPALAPGGVLPRGTAAAGRARLV